MGSVEALCCSVRCLSGFWGARAPSRAGERTSRSRISLLKLLQKETKIAKKLRSWACSFVSFVAFCENFWRETKH
jgi:hypothetical protein